MAALDPEVLKVAVTVSRLAECVRLAELARRHAGRRMVLIAMGEAGLATRLFPGRFGSCWTYAGDGVAPGQIDLERLTVEFRFRRIGPDTDLYGVAGRPVAHSLSPAMHNAAFESLGIDAAYVPLAAADLDDLFDGIRVLGAAGVSVTAPFKVGVMTRVADTRHRRDADRCRQHARAGEPEAGAAATPTSTGSARAVPAWNSAGGASRCWAPAAPPGRWRWPRGVPERR